MVIMRELPCLATPVNTGSALTVTALAQVIGTSQGSAATATHRLLFLSLSLFLAHSKLGILYSIRQQRKRRKDRLGNNSWSNLLTPEKGWKMEDEKKKERKDGVNGRKPNWSLLSGSK